MQLVHSGPVLTHRLASGAQPAEQQVCASAAGEISAYVKTMIASLRYRKAGHLLDRRCQCRLDKVGVEGLGAITGGFLRGKGTAHTSRKASWRWWAS